MKNYDVIIIGAGAAGMMCAGQAAKRGRSVCIIEHTAKIGEKIRISGGGRCNFTNLYSTADNFLSQNPHFCKSALKRYTPHDFIALVQSHDIAYHEKKYDQKTGNENARGQLFCDNSATDIIDMLRTEITNHGGVFQLETQVKSIEKHGVFTLHTDKGAFSCESLVIASGGLSIPKIGASPFGYEIAKQFGHEIIPPRAGLVPLTFDAPMLEKTKPLSGVALDAKVTCNNAAFREGLLFTHRGLSGPSILQISSYWQGGDEISVNLKPDMDCLAFLKAKRNDEPKKQIHTILGEILPSRIAGVIAQISGHDVRIADLSDTKLKNIAAQVSSWIIKPSGSEGYRTAEVTLGGVDSQGISSKTFESKTSQGLYFIGEVLDVTGHLGGHNFQWAWSSGWCAGQEV